MALGCILVATVVILIAVVAVFGFVFFWSGRHGDPKRKFWDFTSERCERTHYEGRSTEEGLRDARVGRGARAVEP